MAQSLDLKYCDKKYLSTFKKCEHSFYLQYAGYSILNLKNLNWSHCLIASLGVNSFPLTVPP